MDPFLHLVEDRVRAAEREGAFANLPGAGKPLALDDLDGVPTELRAGYILLKSAGFVPPELEARKEWLRLGELLAACADTHDRPRLERERRSAWLRYRLLAEQRTGNPAWIDQGDRLAQRLDEAAGVASSSTAPAAAAPRRAGSI